MKSIRCWIVALRIVTLRLAAKSVVHRERFIDTRIKKNGTWICIATNATPITHGGA